MLPCGNGQKDARPTHLRDKPWMAARKLGRQTLRQGPLGAERDKGGGHVSFSGFPMV